MPLHHIKATVQQVKPNFGWKVQFRQAVAMCNALLAARWAPKHSATVKHADITDVPHSLT